MLQKVYENALVWFHIYIGNDGQHFPDVILKLNLHHVKWHISLFFLVYYLRLYDFLFLGSNYLESVKYQHGTPCTTGYSVFTFSLSL